MYRLFLSMFIFLLLTVCSFCELNSYSDSQRYQQTLQLWRHTAHIGRLSGVRTVAVGDRYRLCPSVVNGHQYDENKEKKQTARLGKGSLSRSFLLLCSDDQTCLFPTFLDRLQQNLIGKYYAAMKDNVENFSWPYLRNGSSDPLPLWFQVGFPWVGVSGTCHDIFVGLYADESLLHFFVCSFLLSQFILY